MLTMLLPRLQTPLQFTWQEALGNVVPSIDEWIGGGLRNLVGSDGGHAVRLGIVVWRGQHVAGALSRAGIQAWQRAAYEPKPAA